MFALCIPYTSIKACPFWLSYFGLHFPHLNLLLTPRGQGFNQGETKSCQYHCVSSFYTFHNCSLLG